MSQPASINVLAVSLSARQSPVMLAGSLTTNALHVLSLTPLPRSIPDIRDQLDAMARRNAERGLDATIVVEDPTGLMTGMGYGCRLDDKTTDGRPVLAVAMERYRALSSMGGIAYPPGQDNAFQISDSIMNVKMGDNGKATYEIDWPQLKDASRVLLLLIYGAMCQGPMHSTYLERLYSQVGGTSDDVTLITSFGAITRGYDAAAAEVPTTEGDRKGWL